MNVGARSGNAQRVVKYQALYDLSIFNISIQKHQEYLYEVQARKINKNKPIGSAFFSIRSDEVVLKSICIDEKYRGNGLGLNIMRVIAKQIKKKCHLKPWVIYDSYNDAFYNKLGFYPATNYPNAKLLCRNLNATLAILDDKLLKYQNPIPSNIPTKRTCNIL